MNQIIWFEFETHQVRFVGTWDEPWWVAQDVTRALGIDRTQTRRLDDDEKDMQILHTPGGMQEMLCINESGLYSLVLTSRKPEAKRFKKWLTSVVIPEIRKTGNYSINPQPQQQRLWWDRLKLFESKTRIPLGFFCVFGELGGLMRDLEAKGFVFPEGVCPDISVGLCWCRYLREEKGIEPDDFPNYEHHYPDSRGVKPARIYPNKLRGDFHDWLGATYIPGNFPNYVRKICTADECNMVARAIGYEVKPIQRRLNKSKP